MQATSTPARTELETKTFSVAKLVEAIREGRVRIPRFQRGFKWTDEDRRLLFDSLQAGYPIGTLLLARGAAPKDRLVLGSYAADVPAMNDALWVVDGQQRLSTLAMAFLDDQSGAHRPLFFDLAEQRFVIGGKRRAPPPEWCPVHKLGSSSALSRWVRAAGLPDELSDRADEISGRVREYVVPAYLVPYDGRDDSVLRQVFARVNLRGRGLDSHEVFQALHTAEGVMPIDRARQDLAKLGFGAFDAPLVERVALAVAGGDAGQTLEGCVESKRIDVAQLFERLVPALGLAVQFLVNDAAVPRIELLPYTGALPTLAKMFSRHPNPHSRNRELLARWFWRGTFHGELRVEYSTDRARWRAISDDEHTSVQNLLATVTLVRDEDLPGVLEPKRLRNAPTKIEVLSLLALGPRSLVGDEAGREVPLTTLLESEKEYLVSLLPDDRDKSLAGFIVHPEVPVETLLHTELPQAWLDTHLISPRAMSALRQGDHATFISDRTAALVANLRRFLREYCGPADPGRDRPPIESYFTEEGA